MNSLNGLLDFLDTRSFGALWYWIVLGLVWSLVSRDVLGVPGDVVLRARHATRVPAAEAAETPAEGAALLDWLSLTLPRRRVLQGEAALLLGIGCFGLAVAVTLGFRYGHELAQAAALLLLPLGVLAVLRLRLARWTQDLLDAARQEEVPAAVAAARAARAMMVHRRIAVGLSILAVGSTAAWGTLWRLMHPNG